MGRPQFKLFYSSEPVDVLPKVMGCWRPGLFPRRFVSDILDMCDVQIRLHEANAALLEQTGPTPKETEDQSVSGPGAQLAGAT
jgi:hypothetical protein